MALASHPPQRARVGAAGCFFLFSACHFSVSLCFSVSCPPLFLEGEAVLEDELKALCLLSMHSTTWVTPPALSVLVIFEIGSHFMPRPVWIAILFVFSHIAGITGIYHCTQTLVEMGSHELFSFVLAWNHDPPNLCLPSSFLSPFSWFSVFCLFSSLSLFGISHLLCYPDSSHSQSYIEKETNLKSYHLWSPEKHFEKQVWLDPRCPSTLQGWCPPSCKL
jgi:hypothetical protein